jgi:hypothetical protein
MDVIKGEDLFLFFSLNFLTKKHFPLVINTNSTLDQIHVLKWIVILFFCLMHDLKKSRLVRSTVCFCEIMYVPWVMMGDKAS